MVWLSIVMCPSSWMAYKGKSVENLLKMDDDWGYPRFRKPSYSEGRCWLCSIGDRGIFGQALYDTFSLFGNILSCKVASDSSGKPSPQPCFQLCFELPATVRLQNRDTVIACNVMQLLLSVLVQNMEKNHVRSCRQ